MAFIFSNFYCASFVVFVMPITVDVLDAFIRIQYSQGEINTT